MGDVRESVSTTVRLCEKKVCVQHRESERVAAEAYTHTHQANVVALGVACPGLGLTTPSKKAKVRVWR